jgi:hypothetical protein
MRLIEANAERERIVEVRSYLRCRLGQWQTVKSHIRRRPRRERGR